MRALDISAYLTGLAFIAMLSFSNETVAAPPVVAGDAVRLDSPYLLSPPQVEFTPSATDPERYDVTITLEATGPNPLYQINLWIYSEEDASVFASLKLHPVGGYTWSGTTDSTTPLVAGEYVIDDILLEDGDHSSAGQVGSGSYTVNHLFSDSNYASDARLTDWATGAIPTQQIGVSSLPIVNFQLP